MACSAEEPEPLPTGPPGGDEIQEKCRAWAEVGCRKNTECVGISTSIEQCTAMDMQTCIDEMNAEPSNCRRSLINAIDRCTDGLEAETRDEYCGEDGFCFYYCPHYC